jgi:hypothetical protein
MNLGNLTLLDLTVHRLFIAVLPGESKAMAKVLTCQVR